jgi:hypothetical protein
MIEHIYLKLESVLPEMVHVGPALNPLSMTKANMMGTMMF